MSICAHVRIFMDLWRYVFVHMYSCTQSWQGLSSSVAIKLIFWGSLSLNVELRDPVRQDGQWVKGIRLSPFARVGTTQLMPWHPDLVLRIQIRPFLLQITDCTDWTNSPGSQRYLYFILQVRTPPCRMKCRQYIWD